MIDLLSFLLVLTVLLAILRAAQMSARQVVATWTAQKALAERRRQEEAEWYKYAVARPREEEGHV